MKGNRIASEIRVRSNADESSLVDWGGIGEVAGELVSCLIEGVIDLLLSAG